MKFYVCFGDLFDDKDPKNEDDVWKYYEYLRELLEAATQDYIDDNGLEII